MVRVAEGQKVKIVFGNNYSIQSCRGESGHKLRCSLFSSLNISKYDYGCRADRSSLQLMSVHCLTGIQAHLPREYGAGMYMYNA